MRELKASENAFKQQLEQKINEVTSLQNQKASETNEQVVQLQGEVQRLNEQVS